MAAYFPDVNVLVYAHRDDLPHHALTRDWMESALAAADSVLLLDFVIAGFLRVSTDRRVFTAPTQLAEAVAQAEALLSLPGVLRHAPGSSHLATLLEVAPGATGPLVPDAYLAAAATEAGGTVVSFDRDFARFTGIQWVNPLDEPRG